jgi:hypothetical protein
MNMIFSKIELLKLELLNLGTLAKITTKKRMKYYMPKLQNLNQLLFLIAKNDSLIYEEYWDEYSENSLTNSFSMAKRLYWYVDWNCVGRRKKSIALTTL